MGVEFQLHRGSVHLARGFNQIQKAGDSLADDKYDRATSHLDKALKEFGEASNNFTNAENDAYAKAGTQIDESQRAFEYEPRPAETIGGFGIAARHSPGPASAGAGSLCRVSWIAARLAESRYPLAYWPDAI